MGLLDRQVDWKEKDEEYSLKSHDIKTLNPVHETLENFKVGPPVTEEFECVNCGMKNLKYVGVTEEKCVFCKVVNEGRMEK